MKVPVSTKFVGSYMDPSEEVNARVTAANKAFYKMKTIMRQESGVSKRLKLRLYEGTVKLTLMFSLWTVPLKKAQRDRVDRAHRRHLRDLMGKYYKKDEPMVTCRDVYLETDTVPISVELVATSGHAGEPSGGTVLQEDLRWRSEERDVRRSASHLCDDHGTR